MSEPSSPRVVLVPRWAGRAESDWYPWLVEQVPGIEVASVPDKAGSTLDAWREAVRAALPDDPEVLADTVVVAHSLGTHAVLLALAAEPDAPSLRGVLFVAGWWDISRAFWDRIGESWDAIEPWIGYALDDAAAARRLGRARVLISDDDPIADSSAEVTAAGYRERLGARVDVLPGRKHFNEAAEPAVLEALRELLGAPGS